MNIRNTTLRLGLLLALAGLIAVGTAGAGDLDRDRPGHGARHADGHMERMAARLELDAEQQEAFKAMVETHHESMQPDRELLQQARASLKQAIHADTFDEQAIRSAAASLAVLEADRAVERAQFRQELRGILTDEQLERFDRMTGRHAGHRSEGRRGRGGRDGRGPHGARADL